MKLPHCHNYFQNFKYMCTYGSRDVTYVVESMTYQSSRDRVKNTMVSSTYSTYYSHKNSFHGDPFRFHIIVQ